jgi:tRNA dimethylallyltransferase
MFIDALCNGLDEIPANIQLRKELIQIVAEHGIETLIDELRLKDPIFHQQVDLKNPVRVMRAIEAIRISGKPFSSLRKASKKNHSFEIIRFIINHPREKLYERINLRIDLMLENGLLDEVKTVFPYKDLTALKTVGYSEIFQFLEDKITLENAIDLIKQNSRRYAKRQLTWFRKHEDAILIEFNTLEVMIAEILERLK